MNLGLELLFETFRSIAPDSLFIGGIPLPLEIGAVDLTNRAVRLANPMNFVLLPGPSGDIFSFSGPLPLLYEGEIDLQGTPTPISFPFTLEVDGQIRSDGAELSLSASTSVNESFPPETPVGFADIPLPLPTILPPGETANCLLSQDLMQIDSTLDVGFVLVASRPVVPKATPMVMAMWTSRISFGYSRNGASALLPEHARRISMPMAKLDLKTCWWS